MVAQTNRILVIGSVTIDNIVSVAQEAIERISLHNGETSFLLLEQGRKVDADSISSHVGGGAANVAVAMARQGLDVDILALAGEDLNGRKIRQRLIDEGVGTQHFISQPDWQTGNSILIYSHDQNAAILTKRGINSGIGGQLQRVNFADYRLIYVGCLSSHSLTCLPQIVEQAKAAGCLVAANPCIGQDEEAIDQFLSVAENIDYLSLNKQETIALLAKTHRRLYTKLPLLAASEAEVPPLMRSGLHVNDYWLPLNDVMSMICSTGPGCFSLTDGSSGAYLFDGKQLLYCPAAEVEPMGTAGAGDAFASTIVAQLLQGHDSFRALYAATRNAASVVGYMDTQSGLLRCAEIDQMVETGHPEQAISILGKTVLPEDNQAF
ncbi:carbohydrate kinase family protein [Porticoccus sp.]